MKVEQAKTTLVNKVILPDSNSPGPHPTLILLHGRGADENDLLGLAQYLDARLLIIAVRAPFDFEYGGYTWYDLLEVNKPEPSQFKRSYDLLVNFLSEIKEQLPVDHRNLFLLGFSMGSMMSYSLALTRPHEIKGVIAHSGYIPEDIDLPFMWNALNGTSFFIAHGTLDPVIPIQFGRRAKELLSKSGADVTYREYPIGHQISDESLQDFSVWLQHRIPSK
jgi:phospholipase/carboxylesterase